MTKIWCCGCGKEVDARLTDGAEVYPHRRDLASLPFWKCDACGNFVGCHHKTRERTKPLGCIPTPEIKDVRDSKDQAYIERNHVVAALARLFPSGVQRTNIPDWNSEWHGCVYIDLPAGQISYHFHDSQAHLFADLPPYAGEWDGHDKEVVHARLATISSLEAEREWQPIETAPRDGTTILLIGGAYHGLPWPGQYLESEFRPGMPWVCVIKGNSRLYEHVPTHWRPLPAPPKEEDHG